MTLGELKTGSHFVLKTSVDKASKEGWGLDVLVKAADIIDKIDNNDMCLVVNPRQKYSFEMEPSTLVICVNL